MTNKPSPSRRTGLIFSLYWVSNLINLTLPWGLLALFEISAHCCTAGEAFRHLSLHFYAPGYPLSLVGALSAALFVACAVFLLFHLRWTTGWNPLSVHADRSGSSAA